MSRDVYPPVLGDQEPRPVAAMEAGGLAGLDGQAPAESGGAQCSQLHSSLTGQLSMITSCSIGLLQLKIVQTSLLQTKLFA